MSLVEFRDAETSPPKRCADCGRILDGLIEHRCPGCGCEFDHDEPAAFTLVSEHKSGWLYAFLAASGLALFELGRRLPEWGAVESVWLKAFSVLGIVFLVCLLEVLVLVKSSIILKRPRDTVRHAEAFELATIVSVVGLIWILLFVAASLVHA
jgi:hypothetical protein